jgi:hypothetical protein
VKRIDRSRMHLNHSKGPTMQFTTRRHLAAAVTATALLVGLSACGGSSAGSDPNSSTAATPVTSPSAPGGPPGGFDQANIQKALECLQAAGIEVPSGIPSGIPSGFPSDLPSNATPGQSPPAGFSPPAGGPGGAGNLFSDPKAQAALKICGIQLQSPPAASPSQ